MRKTKRLHSKICHQSGLPKHYRKSVMSRSLTWGLVRLTTTDIFKPYEKLETPQWNLWGRTPLGWSMIRSLREPWLTDSIMWEQFNRGTEGGDINTRGVRVVRFVRSEEEK